MGSLKIHDSINSSDFWLQTPISGLDSPEDRVTVYDKPGEDGAVVSSSFYSSRPVSLQGVIKGANATAFENNRKAFIAACSQQKDSNGYPTPIKFTFTTLAGNTYFFEGYCRKPVMDYDQINFCRYHIEIICADPYIYGNSTNTTTINRAIGGGAIVPFVVPVTLAPGSGGTGTVVNNGNGISYPVLTLTGPLTNPYIANTTVGKVMQLTYTIPSGSFVTIDMQAKTILLNNTSSILSTKTSDSEWWGLIAGSNNLQLSTSSTADTGNLQISSNDAYLGV